MRRTDPPPPIDGLPALRSHRLRSWRDRTGCHYVEGLRSVFAALDAGVEVQALVYCERLAPAVAQQRVRLARRAGMRVLRATPEEFRALSAAPRASGIGAVVRQHWSDLAEIDPRAGLCWPVVGLVRSPGNLGTMLRTAEAAGAAGVIFLGEASDPFDHLVVAASKGGIFRLRLVRATHRGFAAWAARHGCTVVGTAPGGRVDYARIALRPPIAVMFGEERRGLTPQQLSLCGATATIAMSGRADSLNVAVAAGVVLFDIRRRLRPAAGAAGLALPAPATR